MNSPAIQKTTLIQGSVAQVHFDRIGYHYRSAHELCLFCTRGKLPTRKAARSQHTVVMARRRQHSRKPDELYDIIERCSPGPRLELFARYSRRGWYQWGNQLRESLATLTFESDDRLPTTLVHTTGNRHVIHRVPVQRESTS